MEALEGTNILVPEGVEISIDHSLQIHASGRLLVEGNLRIADIPVLPVADTQDGWNLELIADERMTIKGSITGGRGSHYEDLDPQVTQHLQGGRGSTILMTSPDLLVTGLVTAGDGGEGGAGARAGDGGAIISIGALLSDHDLSPSEIESLPTRITDIGGRGGLGGRGDVELGLAPGDSGNSGEVVWHYVHAPIVDLAVAATPGQGEWLASCGDGGPGITPGITRTRNGTNGRPGDNGTASSPNGQPGSAGGDAADATGNAGGNGGNGSACCPDAGGMGGPGSIGGGASAGNGGNGGKGGDAYKSGTQYQGSGGRGGDSGSGGSTTGGTGGKGGDGGNGTPPGLGGLPGSSPTGSPGNTGVVGAGGSGSPDGLPGTAGVDGVDSAGGVGNTGNNGDICPNPGG